MHLTDQGLIDLSKRVQLKPYKPRSFIEREYLTDEELIANVGSTLFVDIELYPNYFLCSFKLHKTNKFVCLEAGEGKSFNPRLLSWIMHNYKTVGFNSIKYDLLILWLAYSNQDVCNLKEASNDIILYGSREYELKKKYNFFTFKTDHIDLIEVAPLGGSLKLYGARIHSPRIQDLPFPDNKELSEEQIEIVKQYNFNDLDVTEQLFDFMHERIALREHMSIEYGEDLRSKSDAQMAEIVLVKKVAALNGKKIERPVIEDGTIYKYNCPQFISFHTEPMQKLLDIVKRADFAVQGGYIIPPPELKEKVQIGDVLYSVGIGGLHSFDKCQGYEASDEYDIDDIDVTSYYPQSIINLGLYPIAMGPNFLTVFKGFKDERVEAKRSKNFTKDKGLKIFLNGTSGKFSDYYSKMRSPNLTIQMNLTGQLSILMLAEMLTCNGIKVISANTDGLTTYCKKSEKHTLKEWITYWEKLTNYNMEYTSYSKYYARDVNAYFAVKLDGSVKKKGPWCEVGSQSGTQLDTNPQTLICTDAIEALLSKNVSIEKTIRECKNFTRFIAIRQVKGGAHKDGEYLGKVVRYAYIKNETGTINYVLNNNKVSNTDGACPFMDLPSELPDIDYDRYIRITTDILYDIGYLKKEKQFTFF